jgi:hypothetical protein
MMIKSKEGASAELGLNWRVVLLNKERGDKKRNRRNASRSHSEAESEIRRGVEARRKNFICFC